MPSPESLKNLEKGVKFEKGKSGNPNGRPKKLVNIHKAEGYTEQEIIDTYKLLLGLSVAKLHEIAAMELKDDKKEKGIDDLADRLSRQTALDSIVSAALIKAYSKGDMKFIQNMLDMITGRPTQHVVTEDKNKSTFNPSKLSEEELIKYQEAKRNIMMLEIKGNK